MHALLWTCGAPVVRPCIRTRPQTWVGVRSCTVLCSGELPGHVLFVQASAELSGGWRQPSLAPQSACVGAEESLSLLNDTGWAGVWSRNRQPRQLQHHTCVYQWTAPLPHAQDQGSVPQRPRRTRMCLCVYARTVMHVVGGVGRGSITWTRVSLPDHDCRGGGVLVVRSGCSGRSGSQEMPALVMPFFLGPWLSPFFWPVMLWPPSAQGLLSTW